MQEESEIQCPFCGEDITVLADVSIPKQNYIEDCSVCCRPISLTIYCEDDAVSHIDVDRSQ